MQKAAVKSQVQKEGWLMKRGHVNKELKRRWIELRKDGTLNYYKEVDSSLRQRGSVNLEKFTIESSAPLELTVCTPLDKRGQFTFRCETLDEKAEWMEAFSAVQSVLCGPCEVKSGFLWKAGEINTAWRRRWCVLTPTELKYYKKDSDVKPAGCVRLCQYDTVSRASLAEVDKAFSFKIQNSANPKQRVFFFSSDSEIEIENWCHAVKTCVEGVDVTVAAEVFKNDPIQHVDVAYKPNETVLDFLEKVCSKLEPQVSAEHYQLIQATSQLPCDPQALMSSFGPISFKVVARKGHAKRKAPPPGIKRIVDEALAEQGLRE